MKMPRLFALTCLAVLAAGPALAEQEVTICQSVNSHTSCVHHQGEGSLSCRSVNGTTRCRQGDESPPPAATPDPWPDDADLGDVHVERHDGRLHLRSGDLDMDMD
jgi:hypothetical protein